MEAYIKCELTGRGSPRHSNTFSNFVILKLLYTTHVSIYTLYCCYCSLHPYRVSYIFLRGRVNIALENTTTDNLVEYQLETPLDIVTVDQEQELHKQNC